MPSNLKGSLQDDVAFIFSQLRQDAAGSGLRSVRSRNNINKALMCLRGAASARHMVISCWRRCLDISPQVFLLLSASLASDSLCRRGAETCNQLIAILRKHRDTLDEHPVLSEMVAEHFSSTQTGLSLALASLCLGI
jgi:hypothetical protein